MWTEEKRELLIKMANDGQSYKEISEAVGKGAGAVRSYCSEHGIIVTGRNATQTLNQVNQFKDIQKERDELKDKLTLIETVNEYNAKPLVIKAKPKTHEATAFAIGSDWHIEEEVSADSVYGLNEFNLKIAETRVSNFFDNFAWLVKKEQKDVTINQAVLALLGDLITGYIHAESMETNSVSPTVAIATLKQWISDGLKFLIDDLDIQKLTVVCSVGNHGRTTEKKRMNGTGIHNSFEWLLYTWLHDKFDGHDKIEFHLPKSYHTFMSIYDRTIRFHHGDNISYGGGVGGITIPINKAIGQWDIGKKADLDIFGHFHQLTIGKKFICNGSLIGYNAYALNIKASFERPKQSFFLFDSDYGEITGHWPIYL